MSVLDLSDATVMLDVRKERGLGSVTEAGEVIGVDDPVGLEAKFQIADLLDIPINSVERFTAMPGPRLSQEPAEPPAVPVTCATG